MKKVNLVCGLVVALSICALHSATVFAAGVTGVELEDGNSEGFGVISAGHGNGLQTNVKVQGTAFGLDLGYGSAQDQLVFVGLMSGYKKPVWRISYEDRIESSVNVLNHYPDPDTGYRGISTNQASRVAFPIWTGSTPNFFLPFFDFKFLKTDVKVKQEVSGLTEDIKDFEDVELQFNSAFCLYGFRVMAYAEVSNGRPEIDVAVSSTSKDANGWAEAFDFSTSTSVPVAEYNLE